MGCQELFVVFYFGLCVGVYVVNFWILYFQCEQFGEYICWWINCWVVMDSFVDQWCGSFVVVGVEYLVVDFGDDVWMYQIVKELIGFIFIFCVGWYGKDVKECQCVFFWNKVGDIDVVFCFFCVVGCLLDVFCLVDCYVDVVIGKVVNIL